MLFSKQKLNKFWLCGAGHSSACRLRRRPVATRKKRHRPAVAGADAWFQA